MTTGGVPSLTKCDKLTIKGKVNLSCRNIFVGTVKIVNTSDEPKTLPPGIYTDKQVDISTAPGAGPLKISKLKTAPIPGQKPGTSGLRKKTKEFMSGLYLHNFVQVT